MTEMLKDIDERTRLAGANKLEMLLFQLGRPQSGGAPETYGLNVFKIREIMQAPEITAYPGAHAAVRGMLCLRGDLVPVIDLAKYIGLATLDTQRLIICTEYNGQKQAFLVWQVDTICRVDWDRVMTPPDMLGGASSLVTSVTRLPDDRLISLLDVEKILADITGFDASAALADITPPPLELGERIVLCCDDSSVARNQVRQTLDVMGIPSRILANGKEAWDSLQSLSAGGALRDKVACIITDVEMPEMDGFTLTKRIKAHAAMQGVPVIMHSSLSAEENQRLGQSTGADFYVPKFQAKRLADTIASACQP